MVGNVEMWPPYGDDEECWRCDGTGYLKND